MGFKDSSHSKFNQKFLIKEQKSSLSSQELLNLKGNFLFGMAASNSKKMGQWYETRFFPVQDLYLWKLWTREVFYNKSIQPFKNAILPAFAICPSGMENWRRDINQIMVFQETIEKLILHIKICTLSPNLCKRDCEI